MWVLPLILKIKLWAGIRKLGVNRMSNGREDVRREIKEIEKQKKEYETTRRSIINEENESGYEADQALKKIDIQAERWRNDPRVYPLLSEQRDGLKKLQKERLDFLDNGIKEMDKERRKLEAREEDCNKRLKQLNHPKKDERKKRETAWEQ